MAGMNRRAFLQRLGIGAGAVALAPVLAMVPSPTKPCLTINKAALPVRQVVASDRLTGISIRFVRQFNLVASTRFGS